MARKNAKANKKGSKQEQGLPVSMAAVAVGVVAVFVSAVLVLLQADPSSSSSSSSSSDTMAMSNFTKERFAEADRLRSETVPTSIREEQAAKNLAEVMQLDMWTEDNNWPPMDSHYTVTDADREKFARDGYIILRQVATPKEIATFRDALLRAVNVDLDPLSQRPSFVRVYNLHTVSDAAKHFILAKRFGQVAADLLGVDGVRLYQDQSFIKRPGDPASPAHQDNLAAPLATNLTAGMWLPLSATNGNEGTLDFFPGSHVHGPLNVPPNVVCTPSCEKSALERLFPGKRMVNPGGMGMQPGDVTFHNGFTVHRAPMNTGNKLRDAIAIQYFADGTKRNGLQTRKKGRYHSDSNSLERWAYDVVEGEVIRHVNTPLVWSRSATLEGKTQ